MASIFRRTHRRKDGTTYKSKTYTIEYTDEFGVRKTQSGFKDKLATQELARKIELEVERIKAGIQTRKESPKTTKPTAFEKMSKEWLATRRASSVSERTAKNSETALRILQKACEWESSTDITEDSIAKANELWQRKNLSSKSINQYMIVAKLFCQWAVACGYIKTNPVKQQSKMQKQRRHIKRPFTEEEIAKLLSSAPEKDATIYKAAMYSGLRNLEIKRLECRDCDLSNPNKPMFRLRAEAQKSKRDVTIPMLQEMAELLKPLLIGKAPEDKVFCRVNATNELDDQMKRAGITKIDQQGRRASWHSFRLTFCLRIAKVLPIQTVKVLMRHASINMTVDVYLDLGITEIGEDIWNLPRLFSETQPKEQQ